MPSTRAQEARDAARQPSDGDKDQKDNGRGDKGRGNNNNKDGDAEMKDAEPEEEEILDEELLSLSTQDLQTRKRLLENDARIMKSEFQRLSHEKATMGEKIKENMEKIANNRLVVSFFARVVCLARPLLTMPSSLIDNFPI